MGSFFLNDGRYVNLDERGSLFIRRIYGLRLIVLGGLATLICLGAHRHRWAYSYRKREMCHLAFLIRNLFLARCVFIQSPHIQVN